MNLRHEGKALGFLLWLGNARRKPGDEPAKRFPVELREVYVEPRPGQTLARSIYPSPGTKDAQGRDIGAFSRDGGRSWEWPAAAMIRGRVISGRPPGGDFAR